MAYILKTHLGSQNVGINEYICDSHADLEKIPKDTLSMGSMAFIIDSEEIYILNSKKEWVIPGKELS